MIKPFAAAALAAILGFASSCLAAAPAGERQVEEYLGGLATLKVKGTDVRVRSKPGLESGIVSLLSRPDRCIAKKDVITDSKGRRWYEIAYTVEQQEETAIFPPDEPLFISADFVTPGPLSEFEQERVEFSRFHIVRIRKSETVSFSTADALPFHDADSAASVTEGQKPSSLPAGSQLELFSMPSSNSDGMRFVTVWRRIGEKRLQYAGEVPYGDFKAARFSSGGDAVKSWLAQWKF